MKQNAARAIARALSGGAPFVRVGGEQGFFLALRRRGELIEDPEGGGLFETLAGGVFRRCEVSSGGWRWLHLGPCDADFLVQALDGDLAALSPADLAAVPADMAFQSMRAERAARSEPPKAVGDGRHVDRLVGP